MSFMLVLAILQLLLNWLQGDWADLFFALGVALFALGQIVERYDSPRFN